MNARISHSPKLGFGVIERNHLSAQPVAGRGKRSVRRPNAWDRVVLDYPLDREGVVGIDQQCLLLVWRKGLSSRLAEAVNVVVQPSGCVFLEPSVIHTMLLVHIFFKQ